MKKRILWIDVAKGICIISVILSHTGNTLVDLIVSPFHIPAFFLLSGYTLKPQYTKDSINKRFNSLMTPYFVTCFFLMIAQIINAIVLHNQFSVTAITGIAEKSLLQTFFASGAMTEICGIDTGGVIGAIWFLPALFFATVVTQLILSHIKRKPVQYAAAATLAVFAFISAKFFWLPFSLQSGLFAVPFTLLGYDLKAYAILEKIKERRSIQWTVIAVSLAFLAICFKQNIARTLFVNATCTDLLVSFIGSVAASLLVIFLSMLLERVKPLAFIGRNSLYVLCAHLFDINALGRYTNVLLRTLHLPNNFLINICADFCSITLITAVVLWVKRLSEKRRLSVGAKSRTSEPNRVVNTAYAALIIFMLIGYGNISPGFWKIIYSFHMPAFVFFMGYLFKPSDADNLFCSIKKSIFALLVPYFLWGAVYICLDPSGLPQKLQTVICAVSFSKKVFPSVVGVGPIWFIPMLFLVRIFYLLICRFVKNDRLKTVVVIMASLFGFLLGRKGFWLPWSFDCALYSLILYHVGYLCKKYHILDYFCRRAYLYFVLSSIWVYVIYSDSMEMAMRNYGNYTLALIGVLSATLLLYGVSAYCANHLPNWLTVALSLVGRNALYILLLHSLLTYLLKNVLQYLAIEENILFFVVYLPVQVVGGCLLGEAISAIKRLCSKIHTHLPPNKSVNAPV